MRHKQDYEEDTEAFPAETYTCTYWRGIAMRVLGWEIVPELYDKGEDVYCRTGLVVVRMVGDDKHWYVEPKTLTPIKEDEYCTECGQIGCCATGNKGA